MKRIYFIMIVFLLTGFGLSAQQTLLFEDFESGLPGQWDVDGTPGDTDWQVGDNLSSTGFTIPPHTNYAASNDLACQCDLGSDIFLSDTISLATMAGLYVSFDSYLPNPFGLASQGFLLVKEPNGTWVQVAEVTANSSWQSLTYSLDGFLGGFVGTDIILGFKHSDQGSQAAGWVIDNVHFYAQHQFDIGVSSWNSPTTGCLTDASTVTVVVENFGLDAVTAFDVYYTLDGVSSIVENVTGVNILPGTTYSHSFANTINLTVGVAHEFNVNVTTLNDGGASNASLPSNIVVKRYSEIPVPYTESFDQNESYYWAVNSNSKANSGITNQEVVLSGSNMPGWVGGLNNTTANDAWVNNVDFHSTISLHCNGGMVPMSTDNLELVLDLRQEAQVTSVYNWFGVFVNGTQLADADGVMNFNPVTINSDPYATKTFNLSSIVGNNVEFVVELKSATQLPNDKVFIDNIIIQPRNESDAGIVQLLNPVSDCGLTDVSDITVVIKNYGVEEISNIPVYYTIDGGSEMLAGYSPAAIQPGMESLPYTFSAKSTSGLEIVGNHQINIYTKLPGDIYFPGNDALLVDLVNYPVYSSFPYEEDFEANHFWTATGTNSSWDVGSAVGTVMTANPIGPNSWVTNPIGNYNNNELSYVTSPCFDFTTLSDPYFEMNIWYETDGGYDGARLEVSIDNGTSWSTVGAVPSSPNGDNWYGTTIDAFSGADGWTGSTNGWVTAHYSLLPFAGETSVKFRVAFASDADNLLNGSPIDYDGFAFDDIVIRDPQANWDIKAIDWLTPSTGYNLGMETVSFTVENLGLNDITDFTVALSFDGGATYLTAEPISMSILSGATATVTYPTTIDFSAWGDYDCVALFTLVDDGNTGNNTVAKLITSLPTITDYPYSEYFQGPVEHWWTAGGSGNSWDLGVPTGTYFPSDSVGDIAWITRLNNGGHYDNEYSWVESPTFDFTSLIQPLITMRIIYDAETTSDGANLQYSENDVDWYTIGVVGVFPNLENWYTNTVDGLAGEAGWTGNSGSWITATQDLTMLSGKPAVKFRVVFGSDGSVVDRGMAFDDIVIEEGAPHDLAVTEWQSQTIACGLSSVEKISVKIENLGFFIEDNYDLTYSITFNGNTVNVTENVVMPIIPGDSYVYEFVQEYDFSVPGNYNGVVTVNLADDAELSNNEITRSLLSSPLVNVFPYSEGFEGSNGNWFVGGTNPSWAVGAPTGTIISTPGTGAASWVTNLSGTYNPSENSYVESPCFDFTIMTNPTIQFKYISNSETTPNLAFAFDGVVLEYSTDGGYIWTQAGDLADTVNWYNYSPIWSLDNIDVGAIGNGSGWGGTSSGWLTAGLKMPSLAGFSNVKFRFRFASDNYNYATFEGFGFDDVLIYNDVEFAGDLGVSNITSAIAGCEFSTGHDVTVTVKNYDLTETFLAGENITVQYMVTGGSTVIESFVLMNDLLAQGETTYTFNTALTLPAGGTHDLTAATVVINDMDPLNDSFTTQIESYLSPVVNLLSVTDVSCFGLMDGVVDLETNANHTYLWTDGYTTEDITVGAGDYFVTVTDNNNCITEAGPFTVAQPLEMTLSLTGVDNICYDQTNGSVTLSVTNGVGPFTYLWSNGETTQNISNLTGGTYSVEVTDANLCVANGSIMLNQGAPFTAVININNPIVCNGDMAGELEVVPSSGTPPYSYAWDTGDNTAIVSGLSAGDYTVVVLDANGCSAGGTSQTIEVPEFVEPPNTGSDHSILVFPTANITADGVAVNPGEFLIGVFYDSLGVEKCGGFTTWQGVVWAVVAKGANNLPYAGFASGETFNWKMLRISDGALFDATPTYDPGFTDQGQYVNNGTSGLTALSGTLVPTAPTANPLSATLIEPAVLSVDLFPSNYNGFSISCFGGTDGEIVAAGVGGVPPYTYAWDNSGVGENIENLSAGPYMVTVTDTYGCTATGSVTLTEPVVITGSLTATDVTCNGLANGTIELTVNDGVSPYTFAWSEGSTIEDLTGLVADDYTVTVTDANGCTLILSAAVNQPMALPLTEDFDLGILPDGWSLMQNPNSIGWLFGTNLSSPPPFGWQIPPHTGYSASNDDAAGPTNDAAMDYLITPLLDLSGYTEITLTFDAFFQASYGEVATVEVSTNGGTTWDVVATLSDNMNWQEDLTVDLTSYTNDPNSCNILIAFHYNDNGSFANGLAIDNVNISGITQYDYDLAVTDFIIPPTEACNLSATQLVTIEITNIGAMDASGFDINYTVDGTTSANETYVGTILSGEVVQYTFLATADFSAVGTYNCGAAVVYAADMQNSNDVLSGVMINHHPTITVPYLEDFEDMMMEYFDITVGTEAGQSIVSDGGDNSLEIIGGDALTGWSGGSVATAADAWGLNVEHQVNAVTLCEVDAMGLQSLELLLDLRQEFANDVTGSWFRVLVDGVQVGPDYNPVLAGEPYQTIQLDLDAYINTTFELALQFSNRTQWDKVLIDNLILRQKLTDVAVTLVTPPAVACPYSNTEMVEVTMENMGGLPVSNFELTLSVNGNMLTETVAGPLNPGQVLTHTFNNVDLTVLGTYTIIADVNVVDDAGVGNDDYTISLESYGDVAVTAIAPTANCESVDYSITLTVSNMSNGDVLAGSLINASYILDGNTVNEAFTLAADLLAGGTVDLTFAAIENGSVGTYIISGTALLANDCNNTNDTYNSSIELWLTPVVNAGVDVGVCDGDMVTLTATGTGTFAWSDLVVDGVAFVPAMTATYTVTITDVNGCTGTDDVLVTVNSIPAVDAGTDVIACMGDNVTLSAISADAVSFAWDNGVTQDMAFVANATLVYTVTIMDINNCENTDDVLVTVNPLPTVDAGTDEAICNGQSVTLTAVGTDGDDFEWNTTANTAEITVSPSVTTTYTVTYSNSTTNCSATDDVTVNVTDGPAIDSYVITNNLCNGGSLGEIEIVVSGGLLPYSFAWSNNEITQNISGLSAGTYTVTVEDAAGSGCSSIGTYELVDPTPVSVIIVNTSGNIGSDISCNGAADADLLALPTNGTPTYSYEWGGGELTNNLQDLGPGTYSVIVTDINGCEGTADYTVTEPDVLGISATVIDLVCFNDLSGVIDITVVGGTEPYNYTWSNGSILGDQIGINAGTYDVDVVDANGCLISAQYVVSQQVELVVTYTQVDVTCNGGSDGSIDVSVTGGLSPYTYAWLSGETVEDISGLIAGDYTLMVTDDNGCVNTTVVTIVEPLSIDLTFANTHVTCFGGSDGAIDMTIANAVGQVTILWSNGLDTEDISALEAGDYDVSVEDANGCMANATVTITSPDLIVITPTVNDVSCFSWSDGSISLSVAGGVSPYTYLWGGGEVTADLTALIAGTYEVTVYDASMCEMTESIVVTEPLGMIFTETIVPVTCYMGTDGEVNLVVTEGMPPYTYAWSNGETTADITGLVADTYDVTVTDFNGCTLSASYLVEEPVMVIADAISNTDFDGYSVSCLGSTDGAAEAVVTAGGVSPFTYLWDDAATQTTAIATGLGAGTYNVTVYDATMCEAYATVTLTEPADMVATAVVSSDYNGYDVSCVGSANGTIDVEVTVGFSPYTYAWSNGMTSEDLVGLPAGTYDVTITDSHGCNGYASATLVDPPELTYSATVSNVACNGDATGSIDVEVAGGTGAGTYMYFWNTGDNTQDLSNLPIGFYYVLVLDANWCHVVSEVFEVGQPDLLLADITITSDFDGYSVSCLGASDGSIDLTVGGGTAPYYYIWSNGGVTEDLSGLSAGTYDVTVSDDLGCVGYATVEITEPMLFEANAYSTYDYSGYSVSCNGLADGGVSVNLVNGFGPFTYLWDNGSTDAMLDMVATGTYYVTVTDSHGCISESMITLTEADLFEVSGVITSDYNGFNVNCNGGADGVIDITVVGGVMPYTYTWTNGEITDDISNSPAGIQEVTVTDANGCIATANFDLTEPELLMADAMISSDYNGSAISCNGMQDATIDLVVTGGTGVGTYSYMWASGEMTEDISGLGAGTYEVTVTDLNGCMSIASVEIVEPEMMDIQVSQLNNSLCAGANNGFAAVTVTGGTTPYMYFWSTGSTNSWVQGLAPGLYYVFGLDANLCATNTYPIEITEPEELIIDAVVVAENICFDDADGAIDLSVMGGSAPYTVNWSNGANTEDISSLAAGTYTVTVIDSHGCSKSTSVAISEPAQITISLDVVHVACFNQGSGSVDMTITNGVSPFTYSWTNGATDEDINNLSGGFFFVTITDATGCSANSGTVVNEPTEIILTMSSSDITCYGLTDGDASVSVSGGTYPPYTYLWSNGETTTNISGLSAGDYEVTVTDANGCTERSDVEIVEPAQIALAFTGVEAFCDAGNGGSIDLTVTGGTGSYNYNWSNSENTEDISGLLSGTYTVTVSDVNGCSQSDSYTVVDAVAVELSSVSGNVSCFGGNDGFIDLTVAGGVSPYSIMWTGPNIGQSGAFDWTYSNTGSNHTILIPNTISNNIGGAPLAAGDYLGVFFDNNGVEQCAGYTMWTGNPLAMSAWGAESGFTNGFAANDTLIWKVWRAADGVVIDAVAGYETVGFPNTNTYSTNGISALTSFVAGMEEDLVELIAGTYSVVVTDAAGCTGVETITISQPTQVLSSVIGTNVSCYDAADGSINLTVIGGTSPYVYEWSTNETTQDISGLVPDTYSVTITDGNNCVLSSTVVISQPDELMVNVVSDNDYNGYGISCAGEQDGGVTATITGGTMPYDISWNTGETLGTLVNLGIGTYAVTITDANGCTTNGSVTLEQPWNAAISTNVSNVSCTGLSDGGINLTITAGGVAPFTYLWSNQSTDQDLVGVPAGTYSVVITDANGCEFTASRTITEPTVFVLDSYNISDYSGYGIDCNGNYTGSLEVAASGGTSPYSFVWDDENSTPLSAISGLNAGTYTVTMTDANGCELIESYTLTQPSVLEITGFALTDILCNGAETGLVDITVAGGVIDYTYDWSNQATTQDLTGVGAGTYDVDVVDANGCIVSAQYVLTQPDAFVDNAVIVDVDCNGNYNGSITLTSQGGTSAYSYLWSNGETTESISGLAGGSYSVAITDANACVYNYSYDVYEPAAILIESALTDILCFGGDNGAIDLTVSGGTAPYSFSWLGGGMLEDLSNLTAGTYEVSIEDANGCMASGSYTLVEPMELASSAVLVDPLCFGDANGTIDATLSGGVLPYYYNWSNGETTANIANLMGGSYTLTVTDGNWCSMVFNYELIEPAVLTYSTSISDYNGSPISCNGESDASIDITISGGIMPYTTIWNTGATSEDISGLSAGTYSVEISDANGCEVTNSTIVLPWSYNVTSANHVILITDVQVNGSTIENGDYIGVFYDQNGTLECGGYVEWLGTNTAVTAWGADGTIDNGFVNNEVFTWKVWRAADGSEVDVNATYMPQFPSTNTFDESGFGLSGISVLSGTGAAIQPAGSASWTLTEPEVLEVSGITSEISCFNSNDGEIDITITGGTAPYVTQWGSLAATAFDWTYVNTGTNHTVIIPASTPIMLNGTSIANGDYIGLFYDSLGTSVCAGFVMWNGVNTNVAAWGTETDLGNGLSLNNGFAYGELLTWKVYQAATGLVFDAEPMYQMGYLDSSNYVTDGMSGLLSLTGSLDYEFAGNEVDMTNLGAGAYQVMVTDANGCTAYSDFVFTQPEEIVVNATITDFYGFGVSACGNNDGAIDLTVTGGVAPYTFVWSNGEFTEDVSMLAAGTYTVVITDASGCMLFGMYEVTEYCNPVIVDCVASDISCYLGTDGSVDLTISGGMMPYTILWSNGEMTEDLSGLAAGNYEVTVTDAYGQVATCSSIVLAAEAMTFDAVITDATTYGGTDGGIDLTVSGGNAPYSYAWTNAVTSEDNMMIAAGWYGCLVTDANGCQIGFNLQVGQPSVTPVAISSIVATDVSCAGASNGSVALTIMDGLAPFTYLWSNGDVSENLANVVAGTYSVTVTDAIGTFASASVDVFEPANVMTYTSASVDAWSCLANGSIDLTVADGTAPYTYMWSNGSTDEDLIDAGYGDYTVVVTDASGCQMTIDNLMINADLMTASVNTVENVCFGGAEANAAVLVNGGALPYTFNWSNGQSVDFIEMLTAGTYTVTVTDYFGCEAVQIVDIIDPEEIVVEIVTNPIGITANVVSGAVGTVTYLWSNGKPYQSIKGLTAGIEYCVTVTDSNGCTGEACYVYTGSSVISFGGNGLGTTAKEVGNESLKLTELDVNVYPNPSKDGKLYIEFDNLNSESLQFEILDSYGRSVYNNKLVESFEERIYVELGNVDSGVYFLRIYTENSGIITKKITIID